MRGWDSEQFRQQIASFEQVAVFDSFINRGEDYDAEYFAPPLMAQTFAQRLGSACDGVEAYRDLSRLLQCNAGGWRAGG
ncbi:hypothetical protein ACLB1S_22120 [Escherichia coli]